MTRRPEGSGRALLFATVHALGAATLWAIVVGALTFGAAWLLDLSWPLAPTVAVVWVGALLLELRLQIAHHRQRAPAQRLIDTLAAHIEVERRGRAFSLPTLRGRWAGRPVYVYFERGRYDERGQSALRWVLSVPAPGGLPLWLRADLPEDDRARRQTHLLRRARYQEVAVPPGGPGLVALSLDAPACAALLPALRALPEFESLLWGQAPRCAVLELNFEQLRVDGELGFAQDVPQMLAWIEALHRCAALLEHSAQPEEGLEILGEDGAQSGEDGAQSGEDGAQLGEEGAQSSEEGTQSGEDGAQSREVPPDQRQSA